MQIWKEEVKYIEDTPIRIILDDEISILKGKLPPHWHNEIEIDLVLHGTCRTDYESAGSARRRDRSAQSLRSDGVDQRHEQHPGKGRGSCIERIGLQVIGNASSPLWLVTGSSICISLLI